ncbi:MAG: hypothetical protein ACRC8Y_25445 [Chroococcales cyanobacterium]
MGFTANIPDNDSKSLLRTSRITTASRYYEHPDNDSKSLLRTWITTASRYYEHG